MEKKTKFTNGNKWIEIECFGRYFYITTNKNCFIFNNFQKKCDNEWFNVLLENVAKEGQKNYGFDIISILSECDYYYMPEKIDGVNCKLTFETEEECKEWFDLFMQARELLISIIDIEKIEIPEWRKELEAVKRKEKK